MTETAEESVRGESAAASVAIGGRALGIEAVMRLLPHRYPFLLIDAVREFEPDVRVVALKTVTAGEWFFAATAPDAMRMPGMLIVEAMAQAGGVLLLADGNGGSAESRIVYFASMDRVRFHAPVTPGDVLALHVTVTHARGRLRKVRAEARVDDAVVCEAEMSAVTMDR